jgi:flagellar protein FlgJ
MTPIIPATQTPPGHANLAGAVKHAVGMLWYEMLSELNKSGLDPSSLGAGSEDFQSMFLWNIAQNDFAKYDTALTGAMTRQVGGTPDIAPASAMVDFPVQVMQLDNAAGATSAITQDEAISLTPAATQPAGNLLTQAKNFAKSIWPEITAAAQVLGVPAAGVLAQSALETHWGSAAPGDNLFGIKAVHGQPGITRPTFEMVDGVLTPETATFRDYPSTAASVADYVSHIQSGYPAVSGQQSVSGFAQALQDGGYATDRNYAAKIVHLSQSPLMQQVLQSLGAATPPNQNMAGKL